MIDVNGTLTVVAPPSGYVVNFERPQRHHQTAVYIAFAVGNLLSFAFLLQRLYTRIYLMKLFRIEDGAVLVAWFFSVGTQTTLLAAWLRKIIGVHAWEMPVHHYKTYLEHFLAAILLFILCTASAKASLCIFYGRLSPSFALQVTIKITLVFIAGAYTACFLSVLFACRPIAAVWDPQLMPMAKCVNQAAIYITAVSIGIAIDLLLLGIPIPIIWKLQMPLKHKLGLTGMFLIGSLTTVTSIIHLIMVPPALGSLDQTWKICEGTFWIIVESNLTVICCCLPTLRRFLKHMRPCLIGEYSDDPTRGESHGPTPRTWGSRATRPKRQFDTLMNTIKDPEDAVAIPLNLRGDCKTLGHRETKVEVGTVRGDDDSEEAILFERSVHVTYESSEDTQTNRRVN